MAMLTQWQGKMSDLFARPAVPVVAVVVAGLIFGLGEMQSHPIRAQVERERRRQVERDSLVEKALHQYTETMRQDNAVELRAWERKLLQNDAQVQGVMEQIAGWMKAGGWRGELKPRPEEVVTPDLPRLARVGLGVEMVSPREVSSRTAGSDQLRLFRMLREISEIPAPHILRRLEVDQTPNGEMRARVELEFFRLKKDG